MSNTISPYVPEQEPFKNYLDRLTAQLSVLKLKDDQCQKYLIAYIGSEAYSQLKDACLPSHPTDKSFDDLVKYLDEIYSPRRLVVSERFKFNQCCQSPGESVQEFITTLKKLASHCEFDTFLDDALRDRLIVGLVDEACQRKLLGESSLNFHKACEKALDSELVKNQSNQINNKSQVNWIEKNVNNKSQSKNSSDQFKKRTSAVSSSSQSTNRNGADESKRNSQTYSQSQQGPYNGASQCYRCGRNHDARTCPAKQWECYNCKIKGHVSVMCRKKKY